MNTLSRFRSVCLIIAAAVVVWRITGPSSAVAHTMPGAGDDPLRSSCVSQIPSLPIDVDVGYAYGFPLEITAPSVSNGQQTCRDFTWIGGFFYFFGDFDPEWGATPITSSAWDCNHSSIEYAVYTGYDSSWRYWGGGLMYGKLSDGKCTYSVTNFPQQPGSNTIDLSNGALLPIYTEFRVAIRSWSHNDRSFGHPGNLCSGSNCYWPTKLLFIGY
jgi:hypothetical protein